MIKGVAVIMLFYLLGECVSMLIGGVVPGSVCGMLMLFTALSFGVVKPLDVKSVAAALTKNMAILFVPVGVGVMAAYDLIAENWLTFLLVPLATTVVVLVVVGHLQQFLEKRVKR